MDRRVISSFLVMTIMFANSTLGADWTQFRGPGGLGVSGEMNLPLKWSAEKNIIWRTKLPGLGTSSPITLGDKIYLTSYSGYAESIEKPGNINDLVRLVVCLNRKTGEVQWSKPFKPKADESTYGRGNNSRHGYSSSTIATDGECLFVFFGASGVYCLNLQGEEVWHASVGTGTRGWGSSNSPVLYKDVVIINASIESRTLVGLDKKTGKQLWQADGIRSSWNTPALVQFPDNKAEVVVSVQNSLLAFDPETGEQLWSCDGIPTYCCPSAISHDGIVYVTGGRGTQYTIAVRAGGRGDVTETHQLWKVAQGSNVSSPVYHEGYLYIASDGGGIAFCFEAATGKVIYQERFRPSPGRIYSSPTLVDGKIYYISQHRGTFVVPAQPKFEQLANNVFSDDDSRTNACPVVSDGQLLLRNDTYLYCIGEK